MNKSPPKWSGLPERRIIKELGETNRGGLQPKNNPAEFGRVIEALVIRELQILSRKRTDTELRFARGYIVDNYGGSESGEITISEDNQIQKQGPRFDIICYHGNVAWTAYSGFPFALVPKSYVLGVIEVKRTVTPKRFTSDSNEHINSQLRNHRNYLDDLNIDIPQVVVATHFFGTVEENRRKSIADHVALLGNLKHKKSATKMVQKGELAHVVDILTGEKPTNPKAEKTKELQNIAKQVVKQDDEDETQKQ